MEIKAAFKNKIMFQQDYKAFMQIHKLIGVFFCDSDACINFKSL